MRFTFVHPVNVEVTIEAPNLREAKKKMKNLALEIVIDHSDEIQIVDDNLLIESLETNWHLISKESKNLLREDQE